MLLHFSDIWTCKFSFCAVRCAYYTTLGYVSRTFKYKYSHIPVTARIDACRRWNFSFNFHWSFCLHGRPLKTKPERLEASIETRPWLRPLINCTGSYKNNMADEKSVFVTVGTTSFDRLTETVSSKPLIEVNYKTSFSL